MILVVRVILITSVKAFLLFSFTRKIKLMEKNVEGSIYSILAKNHVKREILMH